MPSFRQIMGRLLKKIGEGYIYNLILLQVNDKMRKQIFTMMAACMAFGLSWGAEKGIIVESGGESASFGLSCVTEVTFADDCIRVLTTDGAVSEFATSPDYTSWTITFGQVEESEDPGEVVPPVDWASRCDINADGTVSATDVSYLIDFMLGNLSDVEGAEGEETPTWQTRCDVDGDGSVSATDITYIIEYMLGTLGDDEADETEEPAAAPQRKVSTGAGIYVNQNGCETLYMANADIARLTFPSEDEIMFTAVDGTEVTRAIDDVEMISHVNAVPESLTVNYADYDVTVSNPYAFAGVTVEADGAYVTVTNPDTANELAFTLTGSSTDGGFLYNGDYKATLTLDGLNLMSTRGAAVDIRCSKRIAVEVLGENVLIDCPEGTQKACLYFTGHPEFTGDGSLHLTGYTGHALSSKEYIQLKKSFGSLTVDGAEKDGIHAGQYFQMNGGSVLVRGTKGDGIQAEATSKPEDERNGEMIIKGGTIDIECDYDEADCLKADSLMTLSGGNLKLVANGVTGKCIKAKADLEISGAEIDALVTADGIVDTTEATSAPARGPGGGGGGGGWGPGGGNWGYDQEDTETSSSGCIKVDGNLSITGGILSLKATGKGGKCINVDGAATIGAPDTDGPVIVASTTGGVVTGSGENINGLPKAIKVYGNLTIDSGSIFASTVQNGGEGIECKSYLTINGGTVSCQTYDDGINAGAKVTVNGGLVFASASNNDGIDCNGSEGFEFNGGIILASGSSQPEEGFDCDNYSFVINGGTIIGTGGATSTVTKATQPVATASGQSITAGKYLSLVKTDGTVICSYLVPKTLSATVLVSSPEFDNGSTYNLVRNSTAVNNPDATYLDGRFTVGGTLPDGTSKTITPKTK